jgi:hypothetical protein
MHQPSFFNHLALWSFSGLLIGLAGCVEPYMPDVITSPASFLVVDGFINGNGVTTIKLSRTINVAATTLPPPERSARLYIQDDAGRRYSLTEKTTGTYKSDSVVLNPARKYQLRITTASNVNYASDQVPLKVTPPIDKVSWKLESNQVQFTLSTHDPQQQSRYYRWGFIETWQFNAAYQSQLEFLNGIVAPRVTPIYTCWQTVRSRTVKQGSSAQLSQDALTDVALLAISNRSEKLKVRYSVYVSQYAETQTEFDYWELLRKNTEALGTVNDPLPTQLTGNVHRVDNAAEPVLGFIGAHTVASSRVFINRSDLTLAPNWEFETPYATCTLGEEIFKPLPKGGPIYPYTNSFTNPDLNVPIEYILDATGNRLGYIGATTECVDCRVRGSNVKPSFW